MLERVTCDLCGSTDASRFLEVEDLYYGLPGSFTLQRCDACGLVFLSPRPTRDAIHQYYPDDYSNYDHRAVEDEPFFLMRWMRRAKLVQRRRFIERLWKGRPGRLLDVGCSTGLFLAEMKRHGWRVTGVEPSSLSADYARRRFELEVFDGGLLDVPLKPDSVDVITFWDVLEHTHSPSAQLQRASSLLRTGGALVVSVPNWNSLDRRLFGQFWQGLDPPRHLYVFDEGTLTAYLKGAGFAVERSTCFMPGYFSFAMSVERWLKHVNPSSAVIGARILSIPGMRLPFILWFSFLNAIKLGPILTVFARSVRDHGD